MIISLLQKFDILSKLPNKGLITHPLRHRRIVKARNQMASQRGPAREICVVYSRENGRVVISLSPHESAGEWSERRSRFAKNGSEGHFSGRSGIRVSRVLGTRKRGLWSVQGFKIYTGVAG